MIQIRFDIYEAADNSGYDVNAFNPEGCLLAQEYTEGADVGTVVGEIVRTEIERQREQRDSD